MGLSSYHNCNAVQTTLNQEISPLSSKEAALAWELLFSSEDDGVSVPNCLLDDYDPNSLFSPDICPHPLPPTFPCEFLMSVSPEIHPLGSYESLLNPKRQKCFHNQQSVPEFEPALMDGFIRKPLDGLPQLQLPALPHEFEYFTSEANYSRANIVTDPYKKVEEKRVSAQSVSARERRRKISEKTQQLGKLIPGGTKMNTTEMLQAASNYVKFLQAQVGVLELMEKLKESEGSVPTEDLQLLLASSSIQGKLFSKEKCIVPKEFVAALANRHDVQSRPSILDNLVKLIKSDDGEVSHKLHIEMFFR